MAFISNKERNKRVKQSNQSYGLRKLFISITVGLLVLLVIFGSLTMIKTAGIAKDFADGGAHAGGTLDQFFDALAADPLSVIGKNSAGEFGISAFGIILAIITVLTLAFSVVSLVLVLTMKSPKAAKKNINVLQGAAISGKKIGAHANATQIYRERGTNTKKLKNSKK